MHHLLRYRYRADTVHCEYGFFNHYSYPFQYLGPLFLSPKLRFEGSQDLQAGLTSYNMNIANTAMYCAITFIAQGILVCPMSS
jgi:hypothetical protein